MFKKTGKTTTLGVINPVKNEEKQAELKSKINPPPKIQDDKSK